MKKKLQLSIQDPCHENWNEMSPAERGRFCGSCRKTVVDFSGMNDAQVLAVFRKPSTGSVCGRFYSDQLDRPLEPPRRRTPWLRYLLSLMVPAFLISRAGAQRTMGKIAVQERDTTRYPVGHEIKTLGMVLPTEILPVKPDTVQKKEPLITKVKVNGRIVDEDGQPLPGATVTVMQSGKMLHADQEGRFRLIAAKDQLVELVCTAVGFEKTLYAYPFTLQYSSEVDITIRMEKRIVGLDEVLLSSIVCGRELSGVVGLVSEIEVDTLALPTVSPPPKPEDPLIPGARFFPNPALKGQSFYISLEKPEAGDYELQWIDVQGRVVERRRFRLDEKMPKVESRVPVVSPGTYFAVLINRKNGKRYSEKIIIH